MYGSRKATCCDAPMGPNHSAAIKEAMGSGVMGHASDELSNAGVMGHDSEFESLKWNTIPRCVEYDGFCSHRYRQVAFTISHVGSTHGPRGSHTVVSCVEATHVADPLNPS